MASPLGQLVLDGKYNLSCDWGKVPGENERMGQKLSETEQKKAFIRRTKEARLAAFPKQGPMLTILDLDQGTYKQYESRSPLPHRFIPKFCAATQVTMEWLLAGEGDGPAAVHVDKPFRKARAKRVA